MPDSVTRPWRYHSLTVAAQTEFPSRERRFFIRLDGPPAHGDSVEKPTQASSAGTQLACRIR
jgi:hypothetical protein